MPKNNINVSGRRFGRLSAMTISHVDKWGRNYWNCRCLCGVTKAIRADNLIKGNILSCGCLSLDVHTKHGMTKTPEYVSWLSMKRRCLDKDAHNYKYYGGRGIKICNRWLEFENFFGDMGHRPRGTSIDRINNNLGYEPSNCRWADKTTQRRNRNDYDLGP